MTKRNAIALVLMLLLYSAVTPALAGAQDLRAAQLITEDQTFAVTFHRPVLDQGKLVKVNSNTYEVGPELSQGEIARGFSVGERVVIRMTPPVDCYAYIVNNSQWDGATLLASGVRLTAGTTKDFIFRLTNTQNMQGEGRENILFLLRRNLVPEAEVDKHLVPSAGSGTGGAREIRLDNTRAEVKQIVDAYKGEQTRAGKGRLVLSVGCSVAKMFFPFVGEICSAASALGGRGFSAAALENGDEVRSEDPAENMVVQFSFPVSSR